MITEVISVIQDHCRHPLHILIIPVNSISQLRCPCEEVPEVSNLISVAFPLTHQDAFSR